MGFLLILQKHPLLIFIYSLFYLINLIQNFPNHQLTRNHQIHFLLLKFIVVNYCFIIDQMDLSFNKLAFIYLEIQEVLSYDAFILDLYKLILLLRVQIIQLMPKKYISNINKTLIFIKMVTYKRLINSKLLLVCP